ncbi:hypothetical protein OSTOST_04331 [Ostertagia ostertagi]
MAFQLTTPKRLLTMYSNRLETAVARFKSEKIEALNVAAADGDNRNTFMRESMQRLEEAIGALEEAGGKIRELLQEYAETLSSLENPPEKETKDFEEYTSKAEKSLVIAFDYIVLLQARLRAFKSFKEDIISSEEMISIYVGRPSSPRTQERNEYQKKPFHKPLNTCMYCGKNHKSGECDKYKSPQERSNYLRERKLCLICASPRHATALWTEVKKDGNKNGRGTVSARQGHKADKGTVEVNNVGQESTSEEEASILELHSERLSVQAHNTFLPTGQATVLDTNTKVMRRITVLLNTGAQVSFIDATEMAKIRVVPRTTWEPVINQYLCDARHQSINIKLW